MPETEENKQDLVDTDTSGPGAEIELEEEKVKQVIEEKTLTGKDLIKLHINQQKEEELLN